ncbi:MAG: hypothetical protein D6687_05970 [Acidobacteria bacterium]|jgi:hypothetical protein|nr:MAG: hypothetical protein D6687_05970 [Acidobacteriota bacterium]GIU82655.1 MAG: hypothetical protein KatS3mg006_1719 [Pyrinomonadaceae bacterium]
MENFLVQLQGKKVDVACGESAVIRGEIVKAQDGILYLRDEDERQIYVAIDKIAAVWEVKENHHRPGLVGAK